MEPENQKTNIESIIKILTKKSIVKKMIKYDGITIECTKPARKKYEDCEQDLKSLCKELDIPSNQKQVSLERNKEDENLFLLQFPELEPYYTYEQISKMSKEYYRILLVEAIKRAKYSGAIITADLLRQGQDVYCKQVILMLYKSNYNLYKTRLDELLKDEEFINKISILFINVVEDVIKEYNIK